MFNTAPSLSATNSSMKETDLVLEGPEVVDVSQEVVPIDRTIN